MNTAVRIGRRKLHAIADFCVVPLGTAKGPSVSSEVAAACHFLKTFKGGVLKTRTHAYGTNIEGSMTNVLEALEACHEHLHYEHDVPRISTTVKIGTRCDKSQTMEDKINSVLGPSNEAP